LITLTNGDLKYESEFMDYEEHRGEID